MAKVVVVLVFVCCLTCSVNCRTTFRYERTPSISSSISSSSSASSSASLSKSHNEQSSSSHQSSQIERHNLTAIRLANEHLMKIRTNYRCGTPRPTLIRVKDIYNVPSKEYLPRCTVLYQCNDQSGCCEDSSMRCAPSEGHEVQLFFYAIEVETNSDNNFITRRIPFPEVLTFENHTKCQCEEINSRPRSTRINKLSSGIFSNVNVKTNINNNKLDNEDQDQDEDTDQDEENDSEETYNEDDSLTDKHELLQVCKHIDCPVPFSIRYRPDDQQCVCDCFDHDRSCLRVKHGFEKLSSKEKRCVIRGDCLEPECHMGGRYDQQQGKCVIPNLRHSQHHKQYQHYQHHNHHNQHNQHNQHNHNQHNQPNTFKHHTQIQQRNDFHHRHRFAERD